MDELRLLLVYMKKQEIREEYARNTMSLLLRAARPKLKRPLYSEYVREMDKKKSTDRRTGQEIVNDLIKSIKKRRERRKRANGTIHAGGKADA